jgi:hypothetical protein
VQSWFLPSASALHFDPQDEDVLCARYEDVARDPRAFLDRAGAFVGLDYPAGALRFYARTHHTTAGNRGTLSFLRRHEGQPFEGPDAERREADYRHLLAHPGETRLDERWKETLGERERLAFDWFAGAANARWGYPRDRFPVSAVHDFEAATRARPAPPAPPAPPEAPTDRALRVRRLVTNHRSLLVAVVIAWLVTVAGAFAIGALIL